MAKMKDLDRVKIKVKKLELYPVRYGFLDSLDIYELAKHVEDPEERQMLHVRLC